MDTIDYNDKSRFNDRRSYNYGPPDESEERRINHRREEDKFRVWLKAIFDWHMEETITDEQVQKVLKPVLEKVRASMA